ncbi:Fe-S cluster assembly protein SufD [bacterium]|nr:Fe-S cluster assembly protein SufD [bacterium]
MTVATEQKLPVVALSKAIGAAEGDRPATAQLRSKAALLAEAMRLPDSYQERPWKYADVSGLDLAAYQPGAAANRGDEPESFRERYNLEHLAAGSTLVIQKNGDCTYSEASPGVTVVEVAKATGEEAATIDAKLGSVVPPERSKFTALHYAYMRGGLLVDIAANVEVPEPVRIVRELQVGQLAAPHTLIVTGANSRVHVVEDFRSSEADILALPVAEILPGHGATVRYTVLHRWGSNTRVFSEGQLLSGPDSTFVSTNLVVGGRLVKGHVESSLTGRGSSSELFGVFVGDHDQQIDFYTLQDHIGADTRSDLLYKSALADQARSAYYGLTRVGLEARNADAFQQDHNLLLSPEARADSDPVLEILTNDIIRCNHGATTGPVDDEQLFYLESRGVPRKQAEAMLVRGFLNEVLARVPQQALRDEMEQIIDEKLAAVSS